MGVEQVVRGVTAGLLQELFVQSLNLGVLMRTANLVVSIRLVHLLHTLSNLGRILYQRCAAAVQTATGASHDFDEVVGRFTLADVFHHGPDVADAVDDGDLDFQITNEDGSFLDAAARYTAPPPR